MVRLPLDLSDPVFWLLDELGLVGSYVDFDGLLGYAIEEISLFQLSCQCDPESEFYQNMDYVRHFYKYQGSLVEYLDHLRVPSQLKMYLTTEFTKRCLSSVKHYIINGYFNYDGDIFINETGMVWFEFDPLHSGDGRNKPIRYPTVSLAGSSYRSAHYPDAA